MRPSKFTYSRPDTLSEVGEALGSGAMALAGGQSLMPLLKLRRLNPTAIVDLSGVPELSGISRDDEGLVIGAMTRHQAIAEHATVDASTSLLSQAARRIADVQVRGRGTIGGNVCFADPRANMSSALIALDASADLLRGGEWRRVPVADLFADVRKTTLDADELLVRFHVPERVETADGGRSAYVEVSPQLNGVPIVNVAVVAGDARDTFRIAIGGLTRTPCRAVSVEEAVQANGVTADAIHGGLAELLSAREAYADGRGDGVYRAALAATLVGRALDRVSPATAQRGA